MYLVGMQFMPRRNLRERLNCELHHQNMFVPDTTFVGNGKQEKGFLNHQNLNRTLELSRKNNIF